MRCKNEFKQKNVIIVSQGFHNLRALFFARNIGMNALGFDAHDVTKNESYYRNHSREFLARVQAVIYYIFGISNDWLNSKKLFKFTKDKARIEEFL